MMVKKLSGNNSKYNLIWVVDALAWEYVCNVRIDFAKPDTHLCRFLGSYRLGNGKSSSASVDYAPKQIAELSEETS